MVRGEDQIGASEYLDDAWDVLEERILEVISARDRRTAHLARRTALEATRLRASVPHLRRMAELVDRALEALLDQMWLYDKAEDELCGRW